MAHLGVPVPCSPGSSSRRGAKAGGGPAGGRGGLGLGARRGPLGGGRPRPPPGPSSGQAHKRCGRHRSHRRSRRCAGVVLHVPGARGRARVGRGYAMVLPAPYPISDPVFWEWDPTAQHCRGTPWGPRPASLPSAEGDPSAEVPAGSARSSVRPSHAGAREGSRAGPMEGPRAASGWREAAEPKGYRLAGRLRGLGSAPGAPAPAAGTSPSLPLPASVSPGQQ